MHARTHARTLAPASTHKLITAIAAVEPWAREQSDPDVAVLLKAALQTLDRG